MKITATSFTVRPTSDGQVEIEVIDGAITTAEPCLDLAHAAKRLGVCCNKLRAIVTQQRPDLARRVGKDGKIVLPESSLAALLQPYKPKSRVKITEG